jgi:hypothetical protein
LNLFVQHWYFLLLQSPVETSNQKLSSFLDHHDGICWSISLIIIFRYETKHKIMRDVEPLISSGGFVHFVKEQNGAFSFRVFVFA